MPQIAELLKYPDKTPITQVEVRIKAVYKYNTRNTKFGQKTTQDFVIEDASGTMKCEIWEHPELLDSLVGKDVVFSSPARSPNAICIKHDTYNGLTVKLSMGKAANLQFSEVHHANAGTKPTPAQPAAPSANPSPSYGTPPPAGSIRGDKVGMAIKSAIDLEIAVKGTEASLAGVSAKAKALIRLSNELEKGDWLNEIANKPEVPKAEARPPATNPPPAPAKQDGPDEDVPF